MGVSGVMVRPPATEPVSRLLLPGRTAAGRATPRRVVRFDGGRHGYTGCIVRLANAFGRPRWRPLFVVAAVVWALVAVGAHGLLAEHHEDHAPHLLLSSVGAESAATGGHAHLVDGSTHSHHPEQSATAVVPRSASTALVALALVAAALAIMGVFDRRVVMTGRSPPPGWASIVAGRNLLIWLCLARR